MISTLTAQQKRGISREEVGPLTQSGVGPGSATPPQGHGGRATRRDFIRVDQKKKKQQERER